MEYMALATGIRVALLTGMTGSAIMEYSKKTVTSINIKEPMCNRSFTLPLPECITTFSKGTSLIINAIIKTRIAKKESSNRNHLIPNCINQHSHK